MTINEGHKLEDIREKGKLTVNGDVFQTLACGVASWVYFIHPKNS